MEFLDRNKPLGIKAFHWMIEHFLHEKGAISKLLLLQLNHSL